MLDFDVEMDKLLDTYLMQIPHQSHVQTNAGELTWTTEPPSMPDGEGRYAIPTPGVSRTG